MAEELEQQAPMPGVGIDIVAIERMEAILQRSSAFRTKVFTEAEQEYCDSKAKPAVHYAMRFAAKEAVVKALGTGFAEGIRPADIEVTHDRYGRPVPLLHNKAQEVAQSAGVLEMQLSISRTSDTAVANAAAVTELNRVVPEEEKLTPKEQLAQTFRELRGVLDDLDTPRAENQEAVAQEASEEHEVSDIVADS